MYMNSSPKTRYEIIAETIKQDNNLLNISYLCKIAGVSRSGFYYGKVKATAWHQKYKIKRTSTLFSLLFNTADMPKAHGVFICISCIRTLPYA